MNIAAPTAHGFTSSSAALAATPAITTPTRLAEERQFTTHDDVSLFYRRWPALTAKSAWRTP